MYVMGGLNEQWQMVRETNIFDPETGAWTKGPELPGDEMNGFSPAAAVHDGELYVSVADGGLYRLTSEGWQKASAAKPTGDPRAGRRRQWRVSRLCRGCGGEIVPAWPGAGSHRQNQALSYPLLAGRD
jgi:hypothetical protein